MRGPKESEGDIRELRAEVEADPRSSAFVPLARALNDRGDHREAAAIAQRGLLAHPDSVEGRLALAVAEAEVGHVREALEQIKRALLIDQENAEALALMGQILLERGLAQRAAQFLGHAVKLAPSDEGYRALLQQARAAAEGETTRLPRPKPPVFGPDDVPDRGNPWSEGEASGSTPHSEHTVFAPDAGRVTKRPRDSLDDRLAALPSVRDDGEEDEPTRLATAAGIEQPAGMGAGDAPADEQPTRFVDRSERRGKVGGSAAELSRVLRADEAEQARLQAEARVASQRGRSHVEEEPTAALSPDDVRAALAARASDLGGEAGRDSAPEGAKSEDARKSSASEGPKSEDARKSAASEAAKTEDARKSSAPEGAKTEDARKSSGPEGAKTEDARKSAASEAAKSEDARKSAASEGAKSEDARKSAASAGAKSEDARKSSASEGAKSEDARKSAASAGAKSEDAWKSSASEGAKSEDARKSAASEGAKSEDARRSSASEGAKSEDARKSGPASGAKSEDARKSSASEGAKSEDARESPKPARPGAGGAKALAEGAPKKDDAPSDAGASAKKAIGPVATRMVDDALFAILGRRKDSESSPAPAPAAGGGAKPRVVRTSERLGAGARVAGLLVLAAAAFGVGYAASVAPGEVAPELVSEELKGVASELERGGLASLNLAEEHIAELERANPELRPLLAGALAEVHARRYARFGRAPAALAAAQEALVAAEAAPATVESLFARVLTTTAARELERVKRGLAASLEVYPESPKAWVGQALAEARRGHEELALAHLVEARAIHPQHRQTLLETARWLARRGATSAALETYALLQSLHNLDVEVAIERFVLGWATGEDPAPDEAVSALAGLVRDEIPEVAKDEAGRAALAFALPTFRAARVQEGLTELSKAEGAFADSPAYQSTVGEILLALGEGDRAVERFERASELEPSVPEHALNRARARYAREAGLRLELEALRKRVARLQREAPRGEVRLPYGTVRVVPARFTLAEVELDLASFPEDLLAAAGQADGPLEPALGSAVEIALARDALRAQRFDAARSHLEKARAQAELPILELVEGRLLLARGQAKAAAERLEAAIAAGRGGPAALLDLARAREGAEDPIGALDAYQRFFAAGGLSADARVSQAKLRSARGNDEGALEALDAATSLEPEHPGATLTRAEVLLRQERAEEARQALERAIELAPKIARGIPPPGVEGFSPALLTELGMLAVRTDRRLGVALLRAATEEPGAPAKVHFHLGAALVERRSTRREGRRELARYLSLAPEGTHRSEAERLSRRR